MSKKDTAGLAQAWIDFQKNWWAWDKLDEFCRKDAGAAWEVLKELTELADTPELLEDVGVGPLEDFINYYAEQYIDELESAAANSGMAKALSHASVRDADNPLADRLTKIGCQKSGQLSEDED
ncbi:MAG: DUF6869 domain-containing protein [Pseudomonadota bacterium]